MFQDFLRGTFSNFSQISLLEKKISDTEYPLEEYLKDDSAILCVENMGKNVEKYFNSERIKQLIKFVTEEPEEEDQLRGHKFPYVACEILKSNCPFISKRFVLNEQEYDEEFPSNNSDDEKEIDFDFNNEIDKEFSKLEERISNIKASSVGLDLEKPNNEESNNLNSENKNKDEKNEIEDEKKDKIKKDEDDINKEKDEVNDLDKNKEENEMEKEKNNDNIKNKEGINNNDNEDNNEKDIKNKDIDTNEKKEELNDDKKIEDLKTDENNKEKKEEEKKENIEDKDDKEDKDLNEEKNMINKEEKELNTDKKDLNDKKEEEPKIKEKDDIKRFAKMKKK